MNFKKLNTPYPYNSRIPDAYKTILFISWFIFIFVYLFRSDNFPHNDSTPYKLVYSSLYGLATFATAMFNTLIFSYIISPKKEKDWKVWNEIIFYLIHFITISIAIHCLSHSITDKELSFTGIFQSILTTTLIGIIPVSIHVLNEQRKLFKKYFEMAGKMGEDYMQPKFDQSKETITLNAQEYIAGDILYIESNKNYLNIILTDDRTQDIRFTLKEMENLLANFPFFIRCHRAYIVNTNRIKNVEGNAQGLKLFISDSHIYVPVSRSYISRVDHVIRPTE